MVLYRRWLGIVWLSSMVLYRRWLGIVWLSSMVLYRRWLGGQQFEMANLFLILLPPRLAMHIWYTEVLNMLY